MSEKWISLCDRDPDEIVALVLLNAEGKAGWQYRRGFRGSNIGFAWLIEYWLANEACWNAATRSWEWWKG